jgi:hypothetical protein
MTVTAVRLDDMLRLNGENVAIKIDVEGHELAVVEGMRDLLRGNRCLIQAEVYHPRLDEFRAVMDGLGYWELRTIPPDRYFTNFRPPQQPRQNGSEART